MGPDLMDEIDCGNFFDQIEDLIEFPPDSECGGDFVNSDDSKDFPSMWNDALPEPDKFLSGNGLLDLSAELSVPYEDIVQLEWLSTFMEDSFSGGGLTIGKENPSSVNKEVNNPSHNQCQTLSPLSVLESSSSSTSSCSGEKTSPNHHPGLQRARTKRPRPTTFSLRAANQLISPSSSFIETPQPLLESKNFADSLAGPEQKKKKKIKIAPPMDRGAPHQSGSIRKCMHCEITKTPQWRAGPMGPKTLCNACGVRHKSGRLFAEYRPAASPTFVPSLHSNSHKKVLEMRCKGVPGSTTTTMTTSKPEIVPSP